MIDVPTIVARLEQPEYTGANRCLPCTVVNVAIAGLLAIGIGVATSALAGALALTCCLLLVYLRGYLIPGTPALTRRYLPERALEAFGKSPTTAPTVETVSPAELTDLLTAAGVATARADEVRPTPSFRTRWDERLSRDGADDQVDAVRSALGVDDVERVGDASFVLDGRKRVAWESTAALHADVAAAAELRGRLDGWETLSIDERRDLLTGVRLLRERCPSCDGAVTATAERLEHCCRRPRVAVRAGCRECDRPLVDLVVPASNAEPWLELSGTTGPHIESDG